MSYELCCSSSACLHHEFISPYITCYMCSMKILLLYSKNTLGLNWQHRRYWSRSKSLLMRLGHVYRIDQFKKLRRMHKNILLILSLFKNTCSTLYTVCVCEICFLHQQVYQNLSSKSQCLPCVEIKDSCEQSWNVKDQCVLKCRIHF